MTFSKKVTTQYKEPNEHSAPLGFASSILNGTTVEGGLRSLTYKSIYAAELVEELDMARQAVVPSDSPLMNVLDKGKMDETRVTKLQEEVALAKKGLLSIDSSDEVSGLRTQLEQEIASKNLSQPLSRRLNKIECFYDANRSVSFTQISVPGVKVSRMEDVEGFDSSMYLQAAQRRYEEARQLQMQQENDERQKLEQARLLNAPSDSPEQSLNNDISLVSQHMDDISYGMNADISMASNLDIAVASNADVTLTPNAEMSATPGFSDSYVPSPSIE